MKLQLNIKPIHILTGNSKANVVAQFRQIAPFPTFCTKGSYSKTKINDKDWMYVFTCQKFRKKVKQIRGKNSCGRVQYLRSKITTTPHWELRVYKFSSQLPITLEQGIRTFKLTVDEKYK
jgi:hypothetical protein